MQRRGCEELRGLDGMPRFLYRVELPEDHAVLEGERPQGGPTAQQHMARYSFISTCYGTALSAQQLATESAHDLEKTLLVHCSNFSPERF